MSNFTVDILQVRDSSYNIGFKMGMYIRNKPVLKTFQSITKPEIDYQNMKSIFSAYAPHLLDELIGLSEALAISAEEGAALFSGYDIPKV